jgi:glucosamine--fructose-6-phosphate aminotransferase (isomerizing)
MRFGRLLIKRVLGFDEEWGVLMSFNVNNVISNIKDADEVSKIISKYKNIFYLGKGIDYIICEEASLKLREVSYLNSFAFCSGELKHGSIALVDDNTLCIGLLSDEKYRNDICNSLDEVKSRGARVLLIDNDIYSLIVYVELLAYYSALYLNRSIDQPRNLAKSVTVN